jgi:hypothetical protein
MTTTETPTLPKILRPSPEETGSSPEEGGTETAEVCSNGDCYEWSLADLADYSLSAYIFDSYIGGRVGK